MPRVPVYETTQRVNPLPGAMVRDVPGPNAFGAAEGVALVGGTDVLRRRLEEMQREDDAVAVMTAEGMLADWETTELHDPEKGLYARRGKDALGSVPLAAEGFEKAQRDAAQSLQNDAQRNAFARLAQRRREGVLQGVSRHESRERIVHLEKTAESYILQGQNDAINNYTDPEALREARDKVLRGVTVWAKVGGQGPEMVQAKREAALTGLHKAVVERMALDDPEAAQEYYRKHQDEISGTDHTTIEKGLEGAVSARKAEALADAVYLPDRPLGEMESAVRKSEAPQKVKDEALRRLKDRKAVEESDRARHEKQTTEAAWRQIETTQTTDGLTLEQRRVVAGPTMDAMERRAANLRAGIDTTHDHAAWADFRTMEPEEVLKLDIHSRYVNTFDRAHLERAIEIQQAYKAAHDKADLNAKYTNALSWDDRVKRTAQDAQIIPILGTAKDWKGAQAVDFARFEDEAANRVRQYEATVLGGKRKASEEEVQAVLDKIVVERLRTQAKQDKPWGRDPDVDLGSVTEDDLGRVYVPLKKIPHSEIVSLREEFAARGVAKPKDREIERAFAAAIAGNRDLLLKILTRAE